MFCGSFLTTFEIGAVGFDCSIHWLPNESNLKHTLDVRQTNNMKQRTRVFEIQKLKSRNPGGWNNWKHPWSSLRHISPLSLFLIATVADPCKKPNENTLLKGSLAKSGRVKKAPLPNPCPLCFGLILPSDLPSQWDRPSFQMKLAGLTLRWLCPN